MDEEYPEEQNKLVSEENEQTPEQDEIEIFAEEPIVHLTPHRYEEDEAPLSAEKTETPRRTRTKKPKKEKKTVSSAWIPVLLIVAILFGIGGGAVGYAIASGSSITLTNNAPSDPDRPDLPKPDGGETVKPPISGDVRTNEDGADKTPAEVYSENVGAVVGIASESTGRNVWGQTVTQASAGSGFILTADGYVVTNYHVVEGASAVTVQLYDGREFPATIVGYEDTTCDVALLKIEATDLPTVAIGDSDKVVAGEQVCAIGNPLGELTFTLTVGYVSAVDREINTDGTPINMFQTDAAINAGNSGGPLFDMDGNVIGITTAKYSGSVSGGTTVEGLGFAIPINDVMALVDDLTQYGYVTGRPYLGVTVGDATQYDANLPAGAYVSEVQDGFAAQKAGIQPGDVIVGLGGSVVNSRTELTDALSVYQAGDTVSVTVYREGKYFDLTLTLSERPRDTESTTQPTEEESENPFGFPQP